MKLSACLVFFAAAMVWLLPAGVLAADRGAKPDFSAAEKEAEALKPASGLKVEAFATDPQIRNPVALCTDEKGRFWVVETDRFDGGGAGEGVYDIRHIYDRLDQDMACRTVEDRLAMVKRWLNNDLSSLTKDSDRLVLIEDRDGDHRADVSTVFAGGFNDAMDGVAAGVLVRGSDVYFANMPHLWLLRDTNGDNVCDQRTSLSYGYGIRYGFLGHDLHGLIFGPDGRLYFSFGDRGAHVKTKEGTTLAVPDSGAVFRCDPDGSHLELFATGLRNPQELAFDDHGNLFTGDNNCDHGDPARWVYVVEGGDSGWRIGYQHMEWPHPAGPWLSEGLINLEKDNTAAYLLPPIGHIAAGPSGLAHYPGTGLGEQYAGHFFLCDFRAGPASIVHSFANKPKGASFEIIDRGTLLERSACTDVTIGIDGAAYVTDWMGAGYAKQAKGRIYRVFNPEAEKDSLVRETKKLLAEPMAMRSPDELIRLLSHADQRIRQNAQFELARRGAPAVPLLTRCALDRDASELARIHAIWAIGQIARAADSRSKMLEPVTPLLPLLEDRSEEIRAQAIKLLGECQVDEAFDPILRMLADASARVRFFAAMNIGRYQRGEAIARLLSMLAADDGHDAYLRHAGVMGLARIAEADPQALLSAMGHPSPAARMGVLLALRRLGRPEVAAFLDAKEPALVLEAARAINDVPIEQAFAPLAAMLSRPEAGKLPEPVLHRALNAHFRLGGAGDAQAIAAFAASADAPELMRVEALKMLADFAAPRGLDRVIGVWRPLPARDAQISAGAARPMLGRLLLDASPSPAPDAVRLAAIELFKSTGCDESDVLFKLVTDPAAKASPAVGAAALAAMAEQNDPRTGEAVEFALRQSTGAAREQAIRLLARGTDAAGRLDALLNSGSIPDQQAVFAALGTLDGNAAAEQVVSAWMDRLVGSGVEVQGSGRQASTDHRPPTAAPAVPPALVLDLLEAASHFKSEAMQQKLKAYEAARPPAKSDPLSNYRECLVGGDPAAGRQIVFENPATSCIRCHKVNGEGGVAGPDLSDVGARKDRAYLLRSILDPNSDIAPGFENVTIQMKAGRNYAGVVRAENDSQVILDAGDGAVIHAEKKEIARRTKGLSPMPQDIARPLSKRDLRNLVEYLASLQSAPQTAQTRPTTTQTARAPAR